MENRRGDKPWYLTDRARWLAYVYFTQDETIRVDDVSNLDIGVDLLVRPGESRDEDWTLGVVTDGVASLPEGAEKTEDGIRVPRSRLDIPSFSDLPDIPVLFAYYTMSDNQGYGGVLVPGEGSYKAARPRWSESLPYFVSASTDSTDPVRLGRLTEILYRDLTRARVQNDLSSVVKNWTEDNPAPSSTFVLYRKSQSS